MHHTMSPTGVAVLLLFALVVDWMAMGPDALTDRFAFVFYLVAIREGFNGSPLDQWTVGAASNGIDTLKEMTGGAYIAGASTQVVLSAAVGILAIWAVGALLPTKLSTKLGKFATLTLPSSSMRHINWKLLVAATLLGLMADLAGGYVGGLLIGSITTLTHFVAPLPNFLFGAS